MPLTVSARSAWLLGAAVVVFFAYWPTTASLFRLWADVEMAYSHGYFVLPIVVWLLTQIDAQISEPARTERATVGALLFIITALWLVTYRASLQLVHEMLLPVIAALAIWMGLGRQVMRAALFPLGYLYFAMPVWDLSNILLQSIAVDAVRFLLRGLDVTAYFDGNIIHIPAGAFEIAAGCSGLHFFIVAVAIAALYGEIGRDSWRVRLILVFSAAAMAIAMNWVRILTIVLAGYYTDMQHYLVQEEHVIFGWVLFGVFMVLFFAACQRWLPPGSARRLGSAFSDRVPHISGVLLTLACLLIMPALNLWSMPATNPMNFAGLSGAAPGWYERAAGSSQWSPEFPGADRVTQQYFVAGEGGVEVIAAFYAYQAQGKEVVGYATSLTGRLARGMSAPTTASNPRWNEWTLDDASGTWLVWHSYRVGLAWYRNSFAQQLAYGWQSIFGPTSSMAVLVRSLCSADCTQARGYVESYASALEDGIEH